MKQRLPDNSLTIRSFKGDDDLPAVVAFVSMQQEHERDVQPGLRNGPPIAMPHTQAVREKTADRGLVLVALVNEMPVGFVAGYSETDSSILIEENTRLHGVVQNLFVLPNWRHMGIGTRLLTQVEDFFREKGVTRVRIIGPSQNEAMNAISVARGYKPYQTVVEKILPQPMHSLVDGKIKRQG